MFGGNKECKNGALNVVDIAICSYLLLFLVVLFIYDGALDFISNIFWCWLFCCIVMSFFTNGMYVSYLIVYASIFLNTFFDNVLISAVCDDMYPVAFFC